jgi:hypothetical protein
MKTSAKKIFLNEISSGVYDFDLKKNVNIEYFRLLDDGLLTIKQVKNFGSNRLFKTFAFLLQPINQDIPDPPERSHPCLY